MPLNLLLNLVRERLGLNPESLSPSVIPSAAETRMRELGLDDLSAYAALALESAAQFQALVEHIVVAETWFFRGGELFNDLAGRLQELSLTAHRSARVLSVPCSTGEEPYSLAMALVERGVASKHWHVDAVDVSERQLAKARAGRYGELSFRQIVPGLRKRHFEPVGRLWQLRADVRDTVHFRVANVVDPIFLHSEQPYDLILCRNLFIYLHATARAQALENLHRLLLPEGLLCVGHAEPLDAGERRFQRIECPGAFLYRRRTASPRPAARPTPFLQSVLPPLPPRVSASAPAAAAAPVGVSASGPANHANALAEARRFADAGVLSEALAVGEALLQESGPSAEVYGLLGLVHQARREPDEARRCFEKALYLRADDEVALTHLMLLYRQQGETARANLLENRLRRIETGDKL